MPKQRNTGQFGCPSYNQAAKIIKRFGGESRLATLIGLSRVTLYRWNYRRPYGTDGLVPTRQIERIKGVARVEGVLLRDEDWVPERNIWDEAAQAIVRDARKSLADLLA